MPKVDFYILPNDNPNGRLMLACRLAEKAYGLGHRIYIHTDSDDQARQLDDLLWTFRDGSFIPHALCPIAADDISPVLIGTGAQIDVEADILINLGVTFPPSLERFARVAELVNQEPDILHASRQRFRAYQHQGINPDTHKL